MSMSKYKIHIDPPLPDSKQIQGYKDFDSLYGHYQVNSRFNFWRNLYRKPTNFAILVLVVALGALVFDASREDAVAKTDFFLKAPSNGVMPEGKALEIDPNGNAPIPGTNWQLNMSSGIFVDSQGKEVRGNVEVWYRWMPSADQWLKRGLPLKDEKAAYASKGVLEVYAQQAGRPLRLKSGEKLQLLVPYGKQRDFLPMQLDTSSRRWNYIQDTSWTTVWDSSALQQLVARPKLDTGDVDLVAKAAVRKLKAPSRPFGVEVENKNQYPYFKNFEKVYWEYLDLPGSANPWKEDLLGKENGWNKVKIRQTGPKQFTLTFSKILENGSLVRKRVIARPLYKASSKAEAEAIYQENLAKYKSALAAIEQEKKDALAERKRAFDRSVAQWENQKQGGVVFKGSLCHIQLSRLGFVGLMKKAELSSGVEPPKTEGAQRLWWSNAAGDKLIEVRPDGAQKLPKADSSVWYQLVDDHVQAVAPR